jgi:hypothetical protein
MLLLRFGGIFYCLILTSYGSMGDWEVKRRFKD